MRELDETELEPVLRRVLTERLGSLPMELTAVSLERRRVVRDQERRRRRVLTGLAFAAALVIPVGWLAAGAPLPWRDTAIVVMPSERPSIEPTATADPPPPSPTYRGVFVPVASIDGIHSLDRMSNLPGGRVLVFNSGDRAMPGSILDLATGALTPTGTPIAWRSQPDMIELRDGRILVVGGDLGPFEGGGKITDSSAELFDPATGAFSSAGPMASSRWIPGITMLSDGRVLVVGGVQPPGDDNVAVATAEVFDTRTNTFSATGSLRDARIGPSVVALDGGLALVVGGSPSGRDDAEVATAELYDSSSGSFSPVPPPPSIPAPAKAFRYPLRWRAPLVRLADGRALIAGLSCQEVHDLVGGESAGKSPTPSWVFDPVTRRFSDGPVMPHCVERAMTLPNGEVFLTGWYYEVGDNEVRWSGLLDPTSGEVRPTAPPSAGQYMTWLLLPDGDVLLNGGRGLERFE